MRELIKKAMRRTDVVKLGKHQVKIAKRLHRQSGGHWSRVSKYYRN
ncbi:hypothetical protein P7H19_25875 [Paenibacillus larvae]|nr:hypothetical protein [Paenibacillus larvae]MDT2239038.1 hypothetical protein [Paenibacillus larvae]